VISPAVKKIRKIVDQSLVMFLKAVCTIGVFFSALHCSAQTSFAGSWEGKLNIGTTIRLVFNIKDTTDNNLYSTMDSPDQAAMDIACSHTVAKEDSIFITTLGGRAKYSGKKIDGNYILGEFRQNGHKLTLDLKKTDKAITLNRPQTPKPPFEYISEDVVYHNEPNNIQFGATITIPHGAGPFPAVLMITGSGQQNRDEELFGHRPFAVIADYLTKKGYIVLRVDDRGIGKSTGEFSGATSEDFKNDAIVSLNYLRSRKEVDQKKIGLMGHSEGGMIAPMIAVEDKGVDFLVLLAAPGVPCLQLNEEQLAALFEKSGVKKESTDEYLELYEKMVKSSLKTDDKEEFRKQVNKEVTEWRAKTPSYVVLETTNISDNRSQEKFVDGIVNKLSDPWYKYLISYNPQPTLRKLSCKVLALNGEKDIQVLPGSNLVGVKECLDKSHSPEHETLELKGLNHLFQSCKTCSFQEYAQLEETFSPTALAAISDWMDKNVK